MTTPSLPGTINALPEVDSIGTRPDLVITADHAPTIFDPEVLMRYTISYSNTGRMHAEGVVITTTLPPGTTYVDTAPPYGHGWEESSDGQTYTYEVGDVNVGATYDPVEFAVQYDDQSGEIGVPEFNTPFTIGETAGDGVDANPDDNATTVFIGVPDLVIDHFVVEPSRLQPNVPFTFTIVLLNQGTGWALNPDEGGGTSVDVYIAPVASYDPGRYSEKSIWDYIPPVAPGMTSTLVMTLTRGGEGEPTGPITFTEEELTRTHDLRYFQRFYARVDSHLWHPYGLVPEYNEMNNVATVPAEPWRYYINLPLALRLTINP
jgi:uncharacterized repeat protein (TIGR01451 family)